MMQDYEFISKPKTSSTAVDTEARPSKQVVQSILQFARCCQNINIGDVKIKVYLN